MDFKEGQLVIYKNGERYELGKVKKIKNEESAWIWYHAGDTAALTNFKDIRPIVNEFIIPEIIGKC